MNEYFKKTNPGNIIYKHSMKEYVSNILANQEKYPIIKKEFGNKITSAVCQLKKLRSINKKNVSELSKNNIILSLALDIDGLKRTEGLLKQAYQFEGHDSIFKTLRDSFWKENFYDYYAELYAASALTKNLGVKIKFAPANNQGFDLILYENNQEFYASVKSVSSLDPLQSYLGNELLKRSVYNKNYRRTEWHLTTNYSMSVCDSNDVRKMKSRIEQAAVRFLNSYENDKIKGRGEYTTAGVQFEFEIKQGKGKIGKPILFYGRSQSYAITLEEVYKIYGKTFERLFQHSYEAYLFFKEKYGESKTKGCRLVFVPDWANRSLYKYTFGDEFLNAAQKAVQSVGLDKVMKVDILYD